MHNKNNLDLAVKLKDKTNLLTVFITFEFESSAITYQAYGYLETQFTVRKEVWGETR